MASLTSPASPSQKLSISMEKAKGLKSAELHIELEECLKRLPSTINNGSVEDFKKYFLVHPEIIDQPFDGWFLNTPQ